MTLILILKSILLKIIIPDLYTGNIYLYLAKLQGPSCEKKTHEADLRYRKIMKQLSNHSHLRHSDMELDFIGDRDWKEKKGLDI